MELAIAVRVMLPINSTPSSVAIAWVGDREARIEVTTDVIEVAFARVGHAVGAADPVVLPRSDRGSRDL